ncbi:MAG: hypothetical protein ACK4RK_13220 [Gemmataceae bacterium]
MNRWQAIVWGLVLASGLALSGVSLAQAAEPEVADLGERLELFVDQQRIESLQRARLVLHEPKCVETVLRFDKPWEGEYAAYVTVFADQDKFRMYYRGWSASSGGEQVTCYAESKDGIIWEKPKLGLFEFQGSTENNLILKGNRKIGTHNFAPFKDTRPGVPVEQQYKAVAGGPLLAYASPDGIHWKLMADKPVITKGAFDSQNIAFWDTNKQKYVSYYRIFTNRVRTVARVESEDFLTWSEPLPVDFGDTPLEHFYTNGTVQYFRAPHYYFMFPKRFVPTRQRLPQHGTSGISDGVFLTSRDGLRFDRAFMEALIRPGLDQKNWGDRSNMIAWGILQTGPEEMSIYFSRNYRQPSHHMQRGVFRLDGFASARAGYDGGELLTKPLRFSGEQLILNYSTSAVGSVQVEIQDMDGKPIPSYTLADAPELFGDAIEEAYRWKDAADVSKLVGKPVRLRFVLKDADVYSYRFGK